MLITISELQRDAFNSLSIDVTSKAKVEGLGNLSYYEMAESAIKDVSAAIEEYLDRELLLNKHTIYIPDYKWEYRVEYGKYVHLPRHWPPVEIITDNIDIDGNRLLSSTKNTSIELFTGYKRQDQDLAGLQAEFPDLTVEPKNVPHDIRRVAFRLVMYELEQAKKNIFATQSQTQVIANSQVQVTKESRAGYYQSELDKLHVHKYLL